jgi:glycosyltransferase involved in cell wall biosynthesis
MNKPIVPARCLVYAPFSFNGRGPAESCTSIVEGFAPQDLHTELHLGRARQPLPKHITVNSSLPAFARHVPWRFVSAIARSRLDAQFLTALGVADPNNTVAYFWPDPPAYLVRYARTRGIPTVREMINTACATSGPILDAAYARLSLLPAHSVSPEKIMQETNELALYDYVFASNPEVEDSLGRLGIPRSRILSTSFGWKPGRFERASAPSPHHQGVRAIFVGTIGVRKGVPELLKAWRRSRVDGELVLAGAIEKSIANLVQEHVEKGGVRHLGFVSNLGSLYRSSDFFVFPTLEEGGPQVTYEAAGCGLPIITTPMGAARLVETGQTGIVVSSANISELTDAIRLMAARADLRTRYGRAARERAADFDYKQVGAQRCRILREIVAARMDQ